MVSIVIVLACLSISSHGRRMQNRVDQNSQKTGFDDFLTRLLSTKDAATGFQPARSHSVTAKRPLSSGRSAASPNMQSALRESILSEGVYEETNLEFWDPLGLSKLANDGTLAFFRAAEIKHGRVAMLASVGYALGAYGITFPGNIAPGVSFKSVNADGVFNAWGRVPPEGRLQIVTTILFIELFTEVQKPHYTKGGDPGKIPFIYGNGVFGKTSDERLKKAEMKHGRAAMFGIISFLIHHNLPAAVPILPGNF
mmetsp:Transcript_65214/g.120025  ORF Transcript_65214/g.120025 Transcript_65214/m.120025 type:complete len:254 (-) Transcript_65214:63-824(-)